MFAVLQSQAEKKYLHMCAREYILYLSREPHKMKTKFEARECIAFDFVTYCFNGSVEETIKYVKEKCIEEWHYDVIVYNPDGTIAFHTPEAFTTSLAGYM